ncbi:MAG: SDR family oxidoreductase [Candidatus Methylomirabilis sp.]|nr:SDR family oxidoreductase [Deltaproteobacteria bacterium]
MKRIILTGGSSGIGLAATRAFVEAGHTVDVLARGDEEKWRKAAGALADRARYHAMDVRRLDAAASLVADIAAERGGVDVLVNNAGVMRFEKGEDASADSIALHLETNLAAPIRLSSAALAVMAEQPGGGSILNVASVAGLKATPKLSAYAASKAGLIHYTKCIAAEYADRKVRANAICPGAVQTNLAPRVMFAMIAKGVPLGRLQTAEEVARLMAWLVSDEAASVTGGVFSIDGGMSL